MDKLNDIVIDSHTLIRAASYKRTIELSKKLNAKEDALIIRDKAFEEGYLAYCLAIARGQELEILIVVFHVSRYHLASISDGARRESSQWLKDNGYAAIRDRIPIPTIKLPE